MNPKEKTKSRLTSLDIKALVTEIKQRCLGMRVANIYNVDAKTYVFKLSRSEHKDFLIIENGVRFNLTDEQGFVKSKMPSGFTMKFRKFLRSRRLEGIEQIGIERVVVLTFGQDEYKFHLILELYAQGNIILADKDYRIIQLTRQHQFSETASVAPNEIYPFEHTATIYIEKLDTSLENIKRVCQKQEEQSEQVQQDKSKKGKKTQVQATMKLKEVVFKILPCYHTSQVDDLIKQLGLNPNEKATDHDLIKKVVDHGYNFLIEFCKRTEYFGYLIASPQVLPAEEVKEEDKPKIRYFDFVAELALHHQNKYIEKLADFNLAVDKYFRNLDRTEEKVNVEELAWKKFENIKQDQESRIKKLQLEQDEYAFKAALIEEHIQDVQALLDILQKMVSGGLQWDKIAKMINESKKDGDPLANLVHEMDFKKGKITILLGDETSTDDMISCDLDLKLSAYQNSRKYFENKKRFSQKEQKTKEAATHALKQAEANAVKEIEKETQKQMKVNIQRKRYWFEKFYWFISTDGYVVISGRDVQQNELLVKKYLGKNDLYMHADMYGSASTIIKNPEGKVVPDNTLMQAATATMCRSKAWDSKIVVSAWWVYATQVSKSPPTGLSLPAGSFMIYGKKNFVYPARLEMGYTLLFALDQECVSKHAEERSKRFEFQSESQTQQDEADIEASETTEKNMFDSDDEESQPAETPVEEPQSQTKVVNLTSDQIKQLSNGGINATDVTIIEVNPNAKLIQMRHQQKQQASKQPPQGKQPPQKQQALGKKGAKVPEPPKEDLDDRRQVRGRKGKNKKIKDKYADQSDEEREIRMQLMGAKETKQMKISKADKESSEEVVQEQPAKEKEKAPKQTITEQLLQQQQIPVMKEEVRTGSVVVEAKEDEAQKDDFQKEVSSEDEKEIEKDEDELNPDIEFTEVQKLVTYLFPDDTYNALVPMCGPYTVMGNNRYKIKIQPGTLKKGKAAKDIISFFLNGKDVSVFDKKLIKVIGDEELVSNLLSGVKLTGAGMLQLKQKQNMAKKAQQKANPKK